MPHEMEFNSMPLFPFAFQKFIWKSISWIQEPFFPHWNYIIHGFQVNDERCILIQNVSVARCIEVVFQIQLNSVNICFIRSFHPAVLWIHSCLSTQLMEAGVATVLCLPIASPNSGTARSQLTGSSSFCSFLKVSPAFIST